MQPPHLFDSKSKYGYRDYVDPPLGALSSSMLTFIINYGNLFSYSLPFLHSEKLQETEIVNWL